MLTELSELGLRRRPVLSFLPRRHPVNRLLGRFVGIWRERRRRADAGRAVRVSASTPSPATLAYLRLCRERLSSFFFLCLRIFFLRFLMTLPTVRSFAGERGRDE